MQIICFQIGNFICGDNRCSIKPDDEKEEENDKPQPFNVGKSRVRHKQRRHNVFEETNNHNGAYIHHV